jgi:hypothetical protein
MRERPLEILSAHAIEPMQRPAQVEALHPVGVIGAQLIPAARSPIGAQLIPAG